MKFLKPLSLVAILAVVSFQLHASSSFLNTLDNEIAKQTEFDNIQQLMNAYAVPGISLAVIKNRQLHWAQGFGVIQTGNKEKINAETVFSVGSISKVGTAMLTLKKVDQGQLSLNEDVNSFLKSWKIPSNHYTKKHPVTLKAILSHTAGLSVHGFGDFQPGEELPDTIDILSGRYPAKNSPVTVIFIPGSKFKYSGGGTTVQQLILENTSGLDFVKLSTEQLFKPLNMGRSSYQNPLPFIHGNIAKAHNRDGKPRALPRGYEAMPEKAASGLWTTPGDLSKVMISLMHSFNGEKDTFLSHSLTKKMMTRVEPGEFGLGPMIDHDFIFKHGGSNDSYKAFFQGNLTTGNGFIVFTNGANGGGLIKELRAVFEKLLPKNGRAE